MTLTDITNTENGAKARNGGKGAPRKAAPAPKAVLATTIALKRDSEEKKAGSTPLGQNSASSTTSSRRKSRRSSGRSTGSSRRWSGRSRRNSSGSLRRPTVIRLDQMNYYELLGVKVTASKARIRRAYRKLAARFHPDKRDRLRLRRKSGSREDPFAGCEPDHVFAMISTAYNVLSDELRRAMYDVVTGIREAGESEIVEMTRMKQEQAAKTLENMKNSFEATRRKERSKGGLVVLDAVYGVAREGARPSSYATAWVDVTVPLQCMVDASTLIVPRGESKSWLPGFYDPRDGASKQLWVLYEFRGRLHEVVVGDKEEMRMPMRAHLLPETAQASEVSRERRAEREHCAEEARHQTRRARESGYERYLRTQARRERMTWMAIGALAAGAAFHFAFPDESARLAQDTREMGAAAAASASRAAAVAWAQCPAPVREEAEAGIVAAVSLSRQLNAEAAHAVTVAREVMWRAADASYAAAQAWLGEVWSKLPQEQRDTLSRLASEVLAAVREWVAMAAARANEAADTASTAVQAAAAHVMDPGSMQKLLGSAQAAQARTPAAL